MKAILILVLFLIIIWMVLRSRSGSGGKKLGAIDPEKLSLSKKALLKIAAISGHQPDQRLLRSEEVALVLGLNRRSARKLFRAMAQDRWIRFQPSAYSEKTFKLTIVGVEVAANFEKEQKPKFKVDQGTHF
jgi:hypothetical protein